MQAARLKQVNLEIEESTEETKEQKQTLHIQTGASPGQNKNSELIPDGEIDYKGKILLFIEMEKLKLISQAVSTGIPEAVAQEIIAEENLIDFSLCHFKEIVKNRAKSSPAPKPLEEA